MHIDDFNAFGQSALRISPESPEKMQPHCLSVICDLRDLGVLHMIKNNSPSYIIRPLG